MWGHSTPGAATLVGGDLLGAAIGDAMVPDDPPASSGFESDYDSSGEDSGGFAD